MFTNTWNQWGVGGAYDELENEEKEQAVDDAIEALPDTVLAIAAYWRMPELQKKKRLRRPTLRGPSRPK